MTARAEGEALAVQMDGHIVVAGAASGGERHLMWPLPINHTFAQLAFSIDHGITELVAARARRYLPGKGERSRSTSGVGGCSRVRTKREQRKRALRGGAKRPVGQSRPSPRRGVWWASGATSEGTLVAKINKNKDFWFPEFDGALRPKFCCDAKRVVLWDRN
jgi:hypothetical protein